MKANKADRERLIHERALKIQREQGSDVYRAEDYHALARRMIEEEEEMGLPVNPYLTNQESADQAGSRRGTRLETPNHPQRDRY